MRWPWTPRPCPACKALSRRLEDLEADVEHLGQQMIKLRGRVTGGLRREREAQGNGERSEAIVGVGAHELLEGNGRFDYVAAARRARARRQGGA